MLAIDFFDHSIINKSNLSDRELRYISKQVSNPQQIIPFNTVSDYTHLCLVLPSQMGVVYPDNAQWVFSKSGIRTVYYTTVENHHFFFVHNQDRQNLDQQKNEFSPQVIWWQDINKIRFINKDIFPDDFKQRSHIFLPDSQVKDLFINLEKINYQASSIHHPIRPEWSENLPSNHTHSHLSPPKYLKFILKLSINNNHVAYCNNSPRNNTT